MRATAGFFLHLGGIDRAIQIGHGLEDRTGSAVRRHAPLGESRVEFVRLPAVRRDFFPSKRQIAAVLGDVHIARPTADRAGRNRDFLVGWIMHVGLTIQEFLEHNFVPSRWVNARRRERQAPRRHCHRSILQMLRD
jgi:hypothetical protein